MPEGLSPETLVYGFTTVSDPQIAPDGASIVYTLSRFDPESKQASTQLWLCDRDGGTKRRLTQTGNSNGGARWSPDGTRIAFISDRSGKTGLFVMPVGTPGEARLVTEHRAAIVGLEWSPDGSRIAYCAEWDPENPDEQEPDQDAAPPVRVTRRIDYLQDGRGYLNDRRAQVFVVDVADTERRMLTHDPVDHYFPRWSPDGKTLAVSRADAGTMHSPMALIDVDSGDVRLTTVADAPIRSWSPDGRHLLYAGDPDRSVQREFFLYEVATDRSRQLTDDLPIMPDGVFLGSTGPVMPVWLDDRRALFAGLRSAKSGVYAIDVASGAVETLGEWNANLNGLSVDAAGRFLVQGFNSFEANGEIQMFDTRSQRAQVISDYGRAVFAEHSPAVWERLEVKRGRFDIEAWLLKPADFDPSKRYPVVIDIHGGPHLAYGYGFYPIQQVLATNGFLVVIANPRGSTSYGREFADSVVNNWGGEDFLDLMAVVDTVLERPYADAGRTGIFGYSYGGYMTAWTIGQTARFQAAVCGAPCFDLESMYGTSDIGHSFGRWEWGSAPHQDRETYAARSPSTFAHRATTPTLIIHGEADVRCPIGQGEQMFVALKEAGCEVAFARYPGGAHLFIFDGAPAQREDVLTRILRWFKEHLGDPA